MHRVLAFLKAQALPLGMLSGVAVYLLFHWLPILNPLKPLADGANTYVLPIMVFVMLFTTFCKVNPAEMKFCRWHGIMLLLQLSVCLFIAHITFLSTYWTQGSTSSGRISSTHGNFGRKEEREERAKEQCNYQ